MEDEIIIDGITYVKKETASTKKDYSKFIGRWGTILAIKGKTFLRSYSNGDMYYGSQCITEYTNPVSYEECTLSELKPGDVFCDHPDDKIECTNLDEFGVFLGKDNDISYIWQCLKDIGGVEVIDFNYDNDGDRKVHRFLRQ